MPSAPEDEIKALNDDELELVLGYFDDRSEGNPRDAAIVSFLKDTGVRASELLALTWEDITWDGERHLGTVNVTKQLKRNRETGPTKNGKSREAFFNSGTWRHLSAYKNSIGGVPPAELLFSPRDTFRSGMVEPTAPIFLGHQRDREPIGASALGYMLRTAGDELGIPLHPNLFRHTSAKLMTTAEMPPIAIMQILGHSSLAMVTSYSLLWGQDVEDLFLDKMNGNGYGHH